MIHRWLKRLLLPALAVTAAVAAWWYWYTSRDYGPAFLERKGQLLEQRATLERTTGRTSVYTVSLTSTSGLQARARARLPNRDGKFMAVLLAVGLETGQRVIDLLEERDDMVVLAVDYGWSDGFDITTVARLQNSLCRLRTVSNDAVPRLLLALDYLARGPKVDPQRIVVVGVSFGAYQALPATALDPRVSRLVLAEGGGEIGAVITACSPFWKSSLSPRLTGWIGRVLFAPFQPERWIRRVAPRPVTFIVSRSDPLFPVSAVAPVYARAGEPKRMVWHDTPHVAPNAAHLIADLSNAVMTELNANSE